MICVAALLDPDRSAVIVGDPRILLAVCFCSWYDFLRCGVPLVGDLLPGGTPYLCLQAEYQSMSTPSAAVVPISPENDLDRLFQLSERIVDPQLRSAYEVLVVRLRRDMVDSLAAQPNTLQLLMVERTAYHYVAMRARESSGADGTFNFRTAGEEKDYNAFWSQLAEQLSRMMQAGNDEYRMNLFQQVTKAFLSTIRDTIPDETTRKLSVARFNSVLAESLS